MSANSGLPISFTLNQVQGSRTLYIALQNSRYFTPDINFTVGLISTADISVATMLNPATAPNLSLIHI